MAEIQGSKSTPHKREGDILSLSGPALLGVMRAVLDKRVPFRFAAHGYSMSPFIRNGDVLTIAPLTIDPRVGDVVAFVGAPHDRLTVHRIIAARPGGFLIKGDNASETDGVQPRERVLGRVARIERNGHAVRGGLGVERMLIAVLSNRNVPAALRTSFGFPRRVAAAVLRRAQKHALSRAITRRALRVQTRTVIADACGQELELMETRLNPGAWLPRARRNPNVTPYVAKLGVRLAGFVELVRHPPEHAPYVGYWLFSLHVRERYRGLSLGEQLSRRVMEQARAEGARELLLLVAEDNHPAINLYLKLGFVRAEMPALEARLQAEKTQTGRRRIAMRCEIGDGARV